jgi:hypothetical protein
MIERASNASPKMAHRRYWPASRRLVHDRNATRWLPAPHLHCEEPVITVTARKSISHSMSSDSFFGMESESKRNTQAMSEGQGTLVLASYSRCNSGATVVIIRSNSDAMWRFVLWFARASFVSFDEELNFGAQGCKRSFTLPIRTSRVPGAHEKQLPERSGLRGASI